MTTPPGTSDIGVTLDIVPDDDDPHALLAAHDADGAALAQVRVPVGFKLSAASAEAWIDGGCAKPR